MEQEIIRSRHKADQPLTGMDYVGLATLVIIAGVIILTAFLIAGANHATP
jgi:hypothetical protein